MTIDDIQHLRLIFFHRPSQPPFKSVSGLSGGEGAREQRIGLIADQPYFEWDNQLAQCDQRQSQEAIPNGKPPPATATEIGSVDSLNKVLRRRRGPKSMPV